MEELDYDRTMVNKLCELTDEVYAREMSSNMPHCQFRDLYWEQLLNEIILTACTLKRSVPTDIEIVRNGEHYSYCNSVEDAIDDLIFIDGLLR